MKHRPPFSCHQHLWQTKIDSDIWSVSNWHTALALCDAQTTIFKSICERYVTVACGCVGWNLHIQRPYTTLLLFFLYVDWLEEFSNSARRCYAGHAVIKYLVANFPTVVRGWVFAGRFIFPKQVMTAVTLQYVQKLATAKYEVFVSLGVCQGFKKTFSSYINGIIWDFYIFSEVTSLIGAFTKKFCFQELSQSPSCFCCCINLILSNLLRYEYQTYYDMNIKRYQMIWISNYYDIKDSDENCDLAQN